MELTNQEKEKILRKALFVPCNSKDELHRWIKIYLNIDLPDCIVCDDDVRHPPSTSCPMDFLWEIYDKSKKGDDPDFITVLAYAARDAFKTITASIFELLCLFHLKRNVAHLAAIEQQAKESQKDVESFFRRTILREFVTSKNKRVIEMTYYVHQTIKEIISPIQIKNLTPEAQSEYEEFKYNIEILVASMASTNSKHTELLVLDELELAPPAPVQEAKMIPRASEDGKLPITLMTSTRKFSFGLVQKEIDNAQKSGLVIRHWNIIDVTQPCPSSRHLPELPKVPYYVNDSNLQVIEETKYNALSALEQEKYYKEMGYVGCTRNCRLFAVCLGRLATKQTSKSNLLKPIDHVAGLFRSLSADLSKAQLMSWKPSSEGLVYPNFSREIHMITATQMANKMTGEDYPENFTKVQLIELMKHIGAAFYCGMDHGFTHNFAVVTAALIGHILYVFDVISRPGLELMQKIELCRERIYPLQPTIYPDNAYPADNKTFRRFGFRMVDFVKDVQGGIESIRSRLAPGTGRDPTIWFLKDDEGCELLAQRKLRYHWKLDPQGKLTDEPDPDDDDELDAERYLCQNVTINKSRTVTAIVENEYQKLYPKDPNSNWMTEKIKELTDESSPDQGKIYGGRAGIMFIV